MVYKGVGSFKAMAAGDTVASNNVLTVDPDKIGAKIRVMRLKMINNLSRIVVRFLQYRMVSSLYHLIPRQFRYLQSRYWWLTY